MLKINREADTLFTIQVNGQVTAEEMDAELDRLIELSKDIKGGRLLYDIREFEMPSIGAVMVELRKLPNLFGLLSRFDKAAVLAEEPWMRAMAEWEGVLIPGFEIKSFAHKDEKEARAWLET
ncbi:STAS/SEC14 domain-containing protein [Salaquimonas pukyongi]|uniref:STAS/SEC14 domain-containing protein n=1 Tax=Salaquimonas pukyongi TaxID=2712698 RepID=UPI00096BCA2E|nr:STAS/SEC14 domain-containing protein [Salaquimonas pukyongi]